jgi:nitroreductase
LARRWSGRAYDPDKPPSNEQLVTLLEAARWAPSCFGDEPWRFIVCDRKTDPSAWRKTFDCLTEKNQSWAGNAPVLIVITAGTQFERNGKPNRWGAYDTGAAAMSLCVQATEMGLMIHQMGGFDPDRTREAFSIPEQFVPMAMMAVGYQLPEEKIPEGMKEREYAKRNRKPLGECFFKGEWGNDKGGDARK